MLHYTECSFVDEFRWVLPLHYLKNGWQNAVLLWCMLPAGPPSLHNYCAIVLHSCIVLPPVSHSSNHEYHCCQLTRQSSCVSNCKVFIWLSLVCFQNFSITHTFCLCIGLCESTTIHCYFCLTSITSVTAQSKHTGQYPNLPSVMRPVPHIAELPVSKTPTNMTVSQVMKM